MSADSIDVFAGMLQKLMASFAFLVGGVWVLMNYVRNRTHVPRLQVEVKAEFTKRGDRHYLVATCQAKNVGLSIIRLQKPKAGEVGLPGTALSVRMLPQFAAAPDIVEVPWESEVAVFDIFSSHRSIEPGLTISEQKLIYQPNLLYDACWVQLRVSIHIDASWVQLRFWTREEKWSAVAVAIPDDDSRKPVSAPE